MMKNKAIYIFSIIALILAACTADDTETVVPQAKEGEPVSVTFRCIAGKMEYGGGTTPINTRAVDDPEDNKAAKIKTLWVLQYNGTSDTCRLQNNGAMLIEDYDTAKYYGGAETFHLSGSGGKRHTIVFLANYPNDLDTNANTAFAFQGQARLSDLRNSLFRKITNESDLFYTEGGTSYLPMAKEWTGVIATNTNFGDIYLDHTVAKIQISVQNKTLGKEHQVSITSIELCDVPAWQFFYRNTDLTHDVQNRLSGRTAYSENASLPYSDSTTVWSHIWYVPGGFKYDSRNWLKNVISGKSEVLKNMYVDQFSSYTYRDGLILIKRPIYLSVEGTYYDKDGAEEGRVTYKFYLGANMYDDFNVLANKVYKYDIVINELGDQEYDTRVTITPNK